MKRHSDIDPDQDPKNAAAWELLLKARRIEAGPFFARNVLRTIRRLTEADRREHASAGWLAFFSLPRLATGAVVGAAAAVVIGLIVLNPVGSPDSSPIARETAAPASLEHENPGFDMGDYQDEIEMIDYFDDLLAVQDVSVLDDEALSELLF